MSFRPANVATLLLLSALGAHAAPIYKCGPDGKTYSQVPCPEGQVLESSDGRTAAQRAEARRVAAAERKAADDLERQRKAAQKEAAPAAATLGAAPAAAPASAPPAKAAKAAGKKASAPTGYLAINPAGKASAAGK